MPRIGLRPTSRIGNSLTDRIAFWVDLDTAYVTYKNEYIESVWWILKNFWDKGLLYQGFKVVPYCPRCGTPLSDHEVALGYDEAEDPSVFVRLPLVDDARHLAAGLDHHALDAARQRGRGGRTRTWITSPWSASCPRAAPSG